VNENYLRLTGLPDDKKIKATDAQRIFSGDYDIDKIPKKLSSNVYLNHEAFKSRVLELMSSG
jgi:hypothetical protein